MSITYETLKNTLYRKGIKIPYGLVPVPKKAFTTNKKIIEHTEITESDWNALTWNPPEGNKTPNVPDPLADPKPTWAEITLQRDEIQFDKTRILTQLHQEATRRIIQTYGAKDMWDEVKIRLRNEHTPEQDTERDRLIAKYRELKNNIEYMTLDQRRGIDVTVDGIWAETAHIPPEIPNRGDKNQETPGRK